MASYKGRLSLAIRILKKGSGAATLQMQWTSFIFGLRIFVTGWLHGALRAFTYLSEVVFQLYMLTFLNPNQEETTMRRYQERRKNTMAAQGPSGNCFSRRALKSR